MKRPRSSGFNEAALQDLTAKITDNLDRSMKASHAQPKRKQDDGPAMSQKKKSRRLDENRPARVEREGLLKTDQTAKSPTQGALLSEIIALGGDEKDLELVRDVDSDAEGDHNDSHSVETVLGLRTELEAFAAKLGLHEEAKSQVIAEGPGDVDVDVDGSLASNSGENAPEPAFRSNFAHEKLVRWRSILLTFGGQLITDQAAASSSNLGQSGTQQTSGNYSPHSLRSGRLIEKLSRS
jgi:hypothetical protein